MFERIGKIKSTMLGIEDHGIMSFSLEFDFGGAGQAFCGYALDDYSEELKRRVGTAGGMDLMIGIIKACGVKKWEDIQGKTMYALYEKEGWGERIIGIKALPFEQGGTFLIKEWQDMWFPEVVKKV